MNYLKAIYGSVLAGLGALEIAYIDEVLTKTEIIHVVAITLGTASVIWGVPNAGKDTFNGRFDA